MKRLLSVILALSMVLGCTMLSSCASNTASGSSSGISATASSAGFQFNMYDTSSFALTERNKQDMQKKQGLFYEIFVRSFADSNGDGIGDLNGITKKLGYLKDLGIDGIWLTPINESDSYHGYDVTDYTKIDPDFGTEEDLQNLLDTAHSMGIKVILDYVINHTSSNHPWFKEALSAIKEGRESDKINYYRFVKKTDTLNYNPSDKSYWGSDVWHSVGDYAYYGIFSSSMPDLNYNNVNVREEIKGSAKKWLDLGVDGFRLDACMHIYGDHEFNQMSNQTEANVQWWNEFAAFCETINKDVYLVGEAWQNDDVLPEYVQPFDSKFNFAFAENLITCLKGDTAMTPNGTNLADELKGILDSYAEYDTNYIDAVFATNHDQNRVMSEVKSPKKARLAASIYLTLPGNPFIYYGEELGMYGEKPDEKIREPFKWSSDASEGDTTWESDSLNKKVDALDKQKDDENSMYNFYKKVIDLRKAHTALTDGSYSPLDLQNGMVMAYERKSSDEDLIIIHNMSSSSNIKLSNDSFKGAKTVYSDYADTALNGNTVNLEPYSTIIIQK